MRPPPRAARATKRGPGAARRSPRRQIIRALRYKPVARRTSLRNTVNMLFGLTSESEIRDGRLRAAGARVARIESNSVLVATVVLAVVIGVLHPEFFAWDQIKDVLAQSVYVGILAAGMAFLLSMRELDLSVGSVFGLTLIVSALLMRGGMAPWLAAVLGDPARRRRGPRQRAARPGHRDPDDRGDARDAVDVPRPRARAERRPARSRACRRDDSFFTFLGGDALGLPVSVWVLIVTGDRAHRGAAPDAVRLPRAVDRLQPGGGDVLRHLDPARARAGARPDGPARRARRDRGARVLPVRRPERRDRVRAAGDRRGGHRRHAAARRERRRSSARCSARSCSGSSPAASCTSTCRSTGARSPRAPSSWARCRSTASCAAGGAATGRGSRCEARRLVACDRRRVSRLAVAACRARLGVAACGGAPGPGAARRRSGRHARDDHRDHDPERVPGDGLRGQGRGGERGRQAPQRGPERGQRAAGGPALPGRDADREGRHRDDDDDARPVRPPVLAGRRARHPAGVGRHAAAGRKQRRDVRRQRQRRGREGRSPNAILAKVPADAKRRDRHRQPDPGAAGARPARAGHQAGAAREAPEHQARRAAEHRARADAELQRVVGDRPGAPGRARLSSTRATRPPCRSRASSSGPASTLLVGGADVDPVALQAVKDGRVYALVDPEHWLKGYIAIALLARQARDGKALPKGWWEPGRLARDRRRTSTTILARQRNASTRTAWYKRDGRGAARRTRRPTSGRCPAGRRRRRPARARGRRASTKAYGGVRALDGAGLRGGPARSTPSSARTAPASRRS